MSEDSDNKPVNSEANDVDDANPNRTASSRQNQQHQNQFQQQQQQYLAASVPAKGGQSQGDFLSDTFFSHYQPAPNVYDEILDSSRNIRPHWRSLKQELNRIGDGGMQRRWKQIQRMIHQNGIAYTAYGDPSVRQSHLRLDPLPQLFPQAEWVEIKEALQQRLELLNLMLADLYGPRTLLSERVLPVDVLLGHPHYHLPHHQLPTPGGQHVHYYAAELVRSPQGKWWVKADRTDSPGGCGFTLENRIAISRAFPNAFRRCNVHRLAPFFIALRDNLASLAKTKTKNPHIVILSAGAGSSGYFEDSFLAKYLGFTLVETNDLVVRSGRVMLKTLAGLAPVDVIFRRQQSSSLDPLESGGGAPGVPGILQVIREGNVVVVNAPGSGLVESPVFMAFMPRVCKALMNTELKIPGVATWWGGEAQSLELILDRIDDVHLVPAFRERTVGQRQPTRGSALSPKFIKPETMTRDERISLVRTNPTAWVGQEKVARSSAAVWENGALKPGYLSMRTFLTINAGQPRLLPGGMVRISETPHESLRNPFEGGGTKDAWVLADKPVESASLLKSPGDDLQLIRSQGFLPSRVADNLCWLGRYLERADASARLLRAIATRLTGETDPEELAEMPVLVRALAQSGQIESGYAVKELAEKLPRLEDALALQSLDHRDMDSLRFQVDRIVSLAGTVRDRLSVDAWRIVQQMSSSFSSNDPENCDLVDLLDTIETLVVGLAAFSGFVGECMTRTHAFNFLNIGRRLEHALQITTFMKNCFARDQPVSSELLEAVLEVFESGLTYRARYYTNLQLSAVLDLLLADGTNPRSLAYQLSELDANLAALPSKSNEQPSVDQQLAAESLGIIETCDFSRLDESDHASACSLLFEMLDSVEKRLPQIFTSISNQFFVYSGPVHQMIVDPDADVVPSSQEQNER